MEECVSVVWSAGPEALCNRHVKKVALPFAVLVEGGKEQGQSAHRMEDRGGMK